MMESVTSSNKTTHGLFIGVDSTHDPFASIAPLAVRREEKRWFEIFQSALSVSTQTLINRYATKGAICRAIRETVSRTGRGERAVIVFYGHGGYLRRTDLQSTSTIVDFIVPFDASKDNLFTDGDLAVILSDTMDVNVNREIVFIFDCCRQLYDGDLDTIERLLPHKSNNADEIESSRHVFMSLRRLSQSDHDFYDEVPLSESAYEVEQTMEWGVDESLEPEPWEDQVLYIQSAQLDQLAQTTPTTQKDVEESFFGREYSRHRRHGTGQHTIPKYYCVLQEIAKGINIQSPWCFPVSLAKQWEAI